MHDAQLSANVSTSRAMHKGQSNCRFVGLDEYCHLALSRRKLFRHDDSTAELRGLLEPETGTVYWIEEERVAPSRRAGAVDP